MEQRLPWDDVTQGPIWGKREKPLGVILDSPTSPAALFLPPASKAGGLFPGSERDRIRELLRHFVAYRRYLQAAAK
jgi:hypothetical protein